MEPACPVRLPEGWESAWSSEHNRTYYFNRKTGERVWTKPREAAHRQQERQQEAAALEQQRLEQQAADWDSDSDSDCEFVQRQREYARPWEHGMGRQDFLYPDDPRFKVNFEDGAFRQQVRKQIHNKDVNGFYRDEKYKDADVGHIFAKEHGGANTGNNVFMQAKDWNRAAKDDFDELHAAFNGYAVTKKAYEDCVKYGNGFEEGHWGGWKPSDIVDLGKEEFKQVGVLTKKGGGVDGRCKAVRREEVYVDKYGGVHGMKKKLDELRALHGSRKHGVPDSDDQQRQLAEAEKQRQWKEEQQRQQAEAERQRRQVEEDRRRQQKVEQQRRQAEEERRQAEEQRRQQVEAERRRQAEVEQQLWHQQAQAPMSGSFGFHSSSGSANGRELHIGPRGGIFYMNDNGNKTYVKK